TSKWQSLSAATGGDLQESLPDTSQIASESAAQGQHSTATFMFSMLTARSPPLLVCFCSLAGQRGPWTVLCGRRGWPATVRGRHGYGGRLATVEPRHRH